MPTRPFFSPGAAKASAEADAAAALEREATLLVERLGTVTHAALAAVEDADAETLLTCLIDRHAVMEAIEALVPRLVPPRPAGAGFHHAVGSRRAALAESLQVAQQQQLALMKAAARLRDRVADALAQLDRADIVADAYAAATSIGPSLVSVRR